MERNSSVGQWAEIDVTEVTNLISNPIDDSQTLTILQVLISCCLSGVASVLGIATNAICIMVFSRQEFKESTNITLLALAVSDFCCCLTMLWMSVAQTAYMLDPPPFVFDLLSLLAMTGSFPRIIITRVTSWLTALIALERCICVVLPFKVKAIFSPKNTTIMTTGVVTLMFTANMLIYYSIGFEMTINPRFNMSQLIMKTIPERAEVGFYINAIVILMLPLINYVFIVCCALVLVTQLKIATKWRKDALAKTKVSGPRKGEEDGSGQREVPRLKVESTHRENHAHVTKETQLTKLIATTTSVHVICHASTNVALVLACFMPEFSFNGRYSLAYVTLCILGFLLETVNSSISVFVYYFQSSKFKAEISRILYSRGLWVIPAEPR